MNYIGIFYTALIFILCFCAVLVIRLTILGIQSLKKTPEEPPEEPQEKEQKQVYYIVEKKRAKKSAYSQPKEFTFK